VPIHPPEAVLDAMANGYLLWYAVHATVEYCTSSTGCMFVMAHRIIIL
jgi:hypothetical protein